MRIWSRNRGRKQRPNRCIIGVAILPETDTKLTKKRGSNLALCCGAIWRHREKPQYRCTTTIHPVYNCSNFFWENLLHVGLLVRTNLFIPSCFLDYFYEVWHLLSALGSDVRKFFLYRCTSTVQALNYCRGIFFQIPQLSIRSGAHKLFRRFLDFSQFLTAI